MASPEVMAVAAPDPPLSAGPAPGVPLCVDLDGTLVKSDTLVDSVLVMARQRPADLLKIPGWIAQGKASFKRHVTAAVRLDVAHLPYNRSLEAYLREEHNAGRPLYLATAADGALAERVADHLGIFAGVLASDGSTNLAGNNKLQAFQDRFGERFSYIGNADPDLPLLQACDAPMVANPHRSLRGALDRKGIRPVRHFEDRTPRVRGWIRAIRLHQWAKNTLIFVPLLLAHHWGLPTLVAAVLAFFSFGLCASATYIINDLLDLEADRRHPRKRRRPFAAGDLSAISGVGAVLCMLAASFLVANAIPRVAATLSGHPFPHQQFSFLDWLLVYTVTTLTYSFYLKRKLLLDVFVLSGLYTVRILAGAAVTGLPMSPWLAGFSVFFFLSLAFVKRFSELEGLRASGKGVSNGRGYFVSDLEQLRTLGTGSAYAAVVLVTLYITNPETTLLYHHTTRLWLVVPVLLLWLSQIWMFAGRGQMHDDPVVWACTDRRSLSLGLLMAAIIWWAL